MLAATEVKMSGKKARKEKKSNRNTYDISSTKRVTSKFHVTVVQNNGKEMRKESALHVQSFFSLLTMLQ